MFHPTLEGAVYFDIDSGILDGMEDDVSSIFLISSIQVLAFVS